MSQMKEYWVSIFTPPLRIEIFAVLIIETVFEVMALFAFDECRLLLAMKVIVDVAINTL